VSLGVELDRFLAEVPPEYDWLVPDLLERGDRVILTGPEGGGKSTLLRQLAVQLASGIHPFSGARYAPLRVLVVDLENSARQVHRKLRPLRLAAGDRYAGGAVIDIRPEGLDFERDGGCSLEQLVAGHNPDVLITGPVYRMISGDPNEEGPARLVSSWLDKIRTTYGCAVLLEAHSPHASAGGKRPTRPYGASLWLRWPEFGLHLAPGGEVTHWRGPRDEREWPSLLQRGGDWPWTPVTRSRDVLWLKIASVCDEAGRRLSLRDLATATGASKSTIERVTSEHAAEWEALRG
jgi:energy-coupling factor transporter ATP-binding protein EcfA2